MRNIRGQPGRRVKFILCWAVIFVAVDCAIGRGNEPTTVKDLIERFEQSIRKLDCIHLEINELGYRPLVPGAAEELAGGNDFVIFRDGNNWRSTVRRRAIRPQDDGTRVENKGSDEYIVKDFFLRVETIDRSDSPASKNLRLSAKLERPEVEGLLFRELTGMASAVFGVFPSKHGLSLAEELRDAESAEVLPDPEMVNGALTRVVRATGPHGVHTIWFDLNAGCLPRKVEVRAVVKPGEWQGANPSGRGRGPASPAPEAPSPKEHIMRFDEIQIQNLDGTFVVTGFDLSRFFVFEDREEQAARNVLRGKVLSLTRDGWPENPFDPTVEIPNGTPVRVEEEPTIDYAWKDGRIEKVVKVPDTEGASFRQGSRSGGTKYIVLIANVVFLLVIGGVVVLKLWRGRRSG